MSFLRFNVDAFSDCYFLPLLLSYLAVSQHLIYRKFKSVFLFIFLKTKSVAKFIESKLAVELFG